MLSVEFGAVTHPGRVRRINQDSILAAPPAFVVADGVGGSEAGEVASAIVTEEFGRLIDEGGITEGGVAGALQRAHRRIRSLNAEAPNYAATTAAGCVAVLDGPELPYWLVFNVGDSRVYHRSGNSDPRLTQISVDHSYVQELLDHGVLTPEQARDHPERNVVTRAIGAEEEFEPDFWLLPMVRGERLLVCSDGLSEAPEDLITDIVTTEADPQRATEQLLSLALGSGARDNVSAIVVDVVGDDIDSTEAMTETVLTARNEA